MSKKLAILLLIPAFAFAAAGAFAAPGHGHGGHGHGGHGHYGHGGRGGYGGGGHYHRGPHRGYGHHWGHGRYRYWHPHSSFHVGIGLFPSYGWAGPGYWYPGWYGSYSYPAYPYAYGPDTVIVNNPPAPPAPPSQAPVQYWYHCASPKGYYPYVRQCPDGWTKVPATPPPAAAPSSPSNSP
ncbi:MAG: hypothetical protein ACRES9_07885 [Gammaproteobacteria bacterium]